MNDFLQLLFKLLLAHILADFFLQTRKMVRGKRQDKWKSGQLVLHAAIAGFLAYLFVAQWDQWIIVGVVTAVTHWLIDGIKVQLDENHSSRAFVIDQLAHFSVILFIAAKLGDLSWLDYILVLEQNWNLLVMYTIGVLLLLRPSSFLIQLVSRRWSKVIKNSEQELPNAGAWIGYLERLLIFLFIMLGEYAAIGFLIAAKSILRFRNDDSRRLTTEYILLGTLLSFTIAILVGIGTRFVLGLF